MAFGFRKSVKAGPFRLNFSKAGVGISAGTKGARVGLNKRGTYVQVGYGGVYYRKFASHRKGQHRDKTLAPKNSESRLLLDEQEGNLETSLQDTLDKSTPKELLEKLKKSRAPAWEAYVIAVLVFLIGYSTDVLGALVAALVAFFLMRWWGRKRRRAKLYYVLDEAGYNTLGSFQQVVNHLSQSQRLWYMAHAEVARDQKYTGGAGILVNRKTAKAGLLSMPGVKTNVDVYGIETDKGPSFFFLPDGLYVYQKGAYGLFPYTSQAWSSITARFIEQERPPSDAEQIGTTIKYVNKRGGPDKRFRINPKLAVMRYGELYLKAEDAMTVSFQVSNLEISEDVGNALRELLKIISELTVGKSESIQSV